ncbi:MAG TPA: class I SAM-dependent methyltransferase, partial [Thermoanaerobaculia bacterium]|nr:class I SAM-dependent methyltransferase [Thermoanaerobaculia bacterium]
MISRLARLVLPFIDHAATAPFATVVDHPPQVDREVFTRLWEQARSVAPGEVADYERETGYAIDRQWMDDLALRTQIVIKKSELSYLHGRVLYSTLSAYAAQSNATSINVIETGTARGFSSLCMARALADQGKAGKIISFDVVPNEVPTYW